MSVPVMVTRPVRPAHVGMEPTAALKAAGLVCLGFVLFLIVVGLVSVGVSPR